MASSYNMGVQGEGREKGDLKVENYRPTSRILAELAAIHLILKYSKLTLKY